MSDQLDDIIRRALAEDAPWGDVTSEVFLPEGATASASLVAREPGVFSGGGVFARTFELVDADTSVELALDDGEPFATGAVLARVDGSARAVLRGERIALNLVQRPPATSTPSTAPVPASSTRARPRPACGCSSGRLFVTAAAATTASLSRMP
jgi:nicotinate-nucleotide pyrophosphorylase (carboxylating)